MANPVSSVDVPLSIFGSWNTELSPPDIPEGGSPANNDVVYSPGSVSTRPGLVRTFTVPISSLGPTTYEKSFVAPDGTIKNLYLTRGDGKLWVEDVTNAPGVATLLFASAGATYASSCTAQGREYIALSDGVHGADVPISYDGTNVYRVTQDGPGAPPAVQSIALPTSTLATAPGTTIAISTVVYNGATAPYNLTITMAVPTTIFSRGESVTIAGNSVVGFNITGTIVAIGGPLSGPPVIVISAPALSNGTGTGGTLAGPPATLSRSGNTVTGTTSTPHSLQVGYLALIQGVGSTALGGGIATIVLNNEDNPGIATVTTNAAHGLLPNNQVSIVGVTGATVGTAITNVAFAGNIVTITTSAAHGLSVGSIVQVTAVTNTTVNGQWVVSSVPTTTTFTYAFVSIVTAYTAADTGTVTYIWPLASVANGSPAFNFFTVQTAPSPTTFTIALAYTDGTWTGGTVSFGWDGQFYVTAVPTTTSFQYQQYGPDTFTTTAGTVTPYGQASPGIHQLRVSFLLKTGYITPPSPAVTFVANGGQYISVTDLAIGPAEVVARVLQFTGSGGAYFFYIPVPAQVNGLVVSTATQINDNTTTSAVLDFSDNTLYAATAVSVPGNDLAAELVLGPVGGFFTYAGRLLGWGDSNKIENFLNMGIDGGYSPSTPNFPNGWITGLGPGSSATIVPGYFGGFAWRASLPAVGGIAASLNQSAYLDSYGAPIVLPLMNYKVRLWVKPNLIDLAAPSVLVKIASPLTGFSVDALFINSSMEAAGGYVEANFSGPMPITIPPDMELVVFALSGGAAGTMTIDEISIIYADEPYIDNVAKISYVENLEAFDQNTGIMGSVDDLSPIRNFGTIRKALYIVTGTALHETQDNEQTEPSGWEIGDVADNCGAFSIASVGRNAQGIGSAGKDWMMWSGPDGAQIFTGQKPYKVSQEIQSVWDAIPAANQYQCWVKNYESSKRCYFGIPIGSTMTTLVLDYRNIDGAAIAENPPIHISFTGKMIVSDLTRKWTTWTLPAYCGELLYRAGNAQPQIVFGAANPSGAAQSYTLNPLQFHDDDFGVIPASYTTYFFVSHEMEQALQVGSHRHVYTMSAAYISGVGTWSVIPLAASLSNMFPQSAQYPLYADPQFDVDFGINVETTRCAFTIQAQPLADSQDSFFKLQKMVINMARSPWIGVRGSNSGGF